jgi:hypothetical protein
MLRARTEIFRIWKVLQVRHRWECVEVQESSYCAYHIQWDSILRTGSRWDSGWVVQFHVCHDICWSFVCSHVPVFVTFKKRATKTLSHSSSPPPQYANVIATIVVNMTHSVTLVTSPVVQISEKPKFTWMTRKSQQCSRCATNTDDTSLHTI